MSSDQKQSLVLGLLGIVGAAALSWAVLVMLDGWPGPIPDPGERIALALKLAVLPAGFMAVVVLWVSAGRFLTGAFDPLTDTPGRGRAVDMRVLANTVEQTLIFLPLFLAFAMVVGPDESAWLTAAPVVFTLARVVFWIGYRIGPVARAPGMAAGFLVNLGLLAIVVARMVG